MGQLVDGLLEVIEGLVLFLSVESQVPNLLLTVIELLLQSVSLCLYRIVVVGEGGVVGQPNIVLIDCLLKGVHFVFEFLVALFEIANFS